MYVRGTGQGTTLEKKKKKKKSFTCSDEVEENKPDGIRKVACPITGSLKGFDCIDIEVSPSELD